MALRTIIITASRNQTLSTVIINRGPAGADGTGGGGLIAEAEDVATVDLPTLNGPLGTALDSKATLSHTHTVSQITDFPTLATVSTSGAYSDLTGAPSLVVNFGDLGDATTVDLPTVNTPLATALGLKIENGDSPIFGDVTATGTVTSVNGYFDAPVVNDSFTLWVGSLGNRNFTVDGFGNVESKTILPRAADIFSLGSNLRAWKDVTASGTVTGGTIKTGVYTVATLPSGVPGMRATVSDSDKHAQGNFGNTVVAAGAGTSYVVPVFFDGANWIIA